MVNDTIKNIAATALIGAGSLLALGISNAHAEEDMSDKLSVDISLNADAFFGLNPFLGASYQIDDGAGKSFSTDLTAYGIQWGAGTGSDWGQWTEAGFGVNMNFYGGALAINPQLGFTFGSLLSSGAAEEGIVGDGIVPNITINLDTDRFEGQGYAGFYLPLDNNADEAGGQSTNRYIHWWANLGYKINPIVSAGIHIEELFLDGGSNINNRVDGYFWLGPYIQVAKGNAGMRLSFGDDLDDSNSFSMNDFYKLQFFFSF
jgi:hypothetical protein